MTAVQDRTTKYIATVRELMSHLGHATNAELLDALRSSFPILSATTVHRITTRMIDRNELQLAPSGRNNAIRYDANLEPHDHFMCEKCGLLRDAQLGNVIRPQIEKAIGSDCSISGSLTVSGVCKQCHKEEI